MKKYIVSLVATLMVAGSFASLGMAQETQRRTQIPVKKKKKAKTAKKTSKKTSKKEDFSGAEEDLEEDEVLVVEDADGNTNDLHGR